MTGSLHPFAITAVAAAMALGGPAVAPASLPDPAVRHDLHVSHTRLVLDGVHVVARVRLFRDDLAKALGAPIGKNAATRAAFERYLNQHFLVRADGVRLTCRIEDDDADADPNGEPVWWAIIQCDAPTPVRALGLINEVLFDTFRDQQNLVTVIKAPEDERRALYFQGGDRREQTVRF